MFTETPQVRRKLRQEQIAKWAFFGMAASMIVPLVLILGYLVERAWPSLSQFPG
jgi:ABC-type phosphate transport system permease subunit